MIVFLKVLLQGARIAGLSSSLPAHAHKFSNESTGNTFGIHEQSNWFVQKHFDELVNGISHRSREKPGLTREVGPDDDFFSEFVEQYCPPHAIPDIHSIEIKEGELRIQSSKRPGIIIMSVAFVAHDSWDFQGHTI